MDDSTSPVSHRAKRQKLDKKGRFAALEKLKQLKGSKHKYEISSVENVYEEVDEKEYTKRVLNRQDDDWIVDDDGSGYVEDGREIFDDDLDDEAIESASRRKKEGGGGKRGRPSSKVVKQPQTSSGSASIRSLFSNMPAKKKKEAPVKLDEDDILGDIMQEINDDADSAPTRNNATRTAGPPTPFPVSTEVSAKSYLQSFAAKVQVRPRNLNKTILAPKNIDVVKDESEDESSVTEVLTPTIEPVPSQRMNGAFDTSVKVKKYFDSDDEFPDPSDMEEMKIEDVDSQPTQDIKIEDTDTQDLQMEDKENLLAMVAEEAIKQEEKLQLKQEPSSGLGAVLDKKMTEEQMLAGWETMQGAGLQSNACAEVRVDPSHLPLTTTDTGDKVLRFFWLDAYEDPWKQPGTVFLFGKVWIETAKAHVSCCVTVKNIDRRIFLLPREETEDGKEVSIMDVYQEFNEKIAAQFNILQFKSRKVERSYCFDDVTDVPLTSEYLEVKYSASQPAIPSNTSGRTFSHVFGSNKSPLEMLLLDRKIKGPCWLDITEPQAVNNPMSWCKVEVVALKPEHLVVCKSSLKLAPPPLVVLTWNMRTTVNPKTSQSEVTMLACLVHHAFPLDRAAPQPPFQQHFCMFTKPSDVLFPYDLKDVLPRYTATKVDRIESERALLSMFLARLFKIDPDLIVGHDILSFDLEVLVHRLAVNKIPNWSKLGRLRRAAIPMGNRNKVFADRNFACGRLVCDIKISAKELIRARSYDLGNLCQVVLKVKEDERMDLTMDEVRGMYQSSTKLLQLVSLSMQDAAYIIRLMCELNVLPLALQITNIAGNVLSRTLMGGRSERNEFLLLHAFTEKNFIVPDKKYKKAGAKEPDPDEDVDAAEGTTSKARQAKGRKKPAYAGGLVLEPKKGFYDKLILLMDFNSLYPSIIQEYNICFTTVTRPAVTTTADGEEVLPDLPESGLEPGILPTEISKLVQSRREVKKLMKTPDLSPDLKMQYNIRQMALKLTANSMYGCLGFSNSRFYAKPLAALITAKGREILMNTKDLVEKLNYNVIYGDTDSIMINTNSLDVDQVFKIGYKIKQEVNKMYRQVELDIDGIFKYMLLLKKKKYAAVTLTRLPSGELVTQQEMKGLDIVRRDWSQLSAEAGKFILQQILSDQSADDRIENIHAHLMQLREDLEEGRVPLQLLTITKQLTKSVELYADSKSLPHVQVAMRLNSKGGHRFKAGDTVSYVVCEDGSNLPPAQRAYHVDELKGKESLKIDVKYYLAHQIHPVVSRLCDPIEGTDAARIAECLGLDPNAYHQVQKHQPSTQDESVGDSAILNEEERFKHCDRFKFRCVNDMCNSEITVDGPFCKTESGSYPVLERCVNPECSVAPTAYLPSIQNQLSLVTRSYIHKYYLNWLVCEDPACPNRTRRVPLRFMRSYPICTLCEKGVMYKEYNDHELYTQLNFFQHIFDLSKAAERKAGLKIGTDLEMAYGKLRDHIERLLRHSAYSVVNLSRLFEGLMLPKIHSGPVKSEKS
ncbi:DNA polymerase alpha catalytic subunit [Anabrus simplex]|uniref:DNA polymerase alpha catalytic subunit n=1 Tax=Anabrus simplex TaxID=316456 RepID=UPI0035A280B5